MLKKILLLAGLQLSIYSCTTTNEEQNDPKLAFEKASTSYNDGHYEIAITKLGEFKSKFPYSQYAVTAELYIANAQFELRRYAEAGESYKQFAKLHPNHSELAFAMFRVGDTYWQEAPEEIDREQDFTQQAIIYWKELIDKFPKSEHAQKAADLIAIGQDRISKSHDFIAEFYCKQKVWHACAYRSLKLIEEFPDKTHLIKTSLRRAARAFREMVKADSSSLEKQKDSNYFLKTMTKEQILEKAASLEKRSTTL